MNEELRRTILDCVHRIKAKLDRLSDQDEVVRGLLGCIEAAVETPAACPRPPHNALARKLREDDNYPFTQSNYPFIGDGKIIANDSRSMTGAEVRKLMGCPASFGLFVEGQGGESDSWVMNDQLVVIEDQIFYSVPYGMSS